VKDGVLLEAVMEGSAADKAGIKAGDILIQLGDAKVTDLDAFQNALTAHQPGDKVKAVVRRGERTVEAEVTLGRRRGP
jgi:S1-C subfamily serine protease